MKTLLKLEEFFEFLLGLYFFYHLSYAWWWFPLLLFTPDLSMIGYAMNPKIGAWAYNLFHHKALAIFLLFLGYFLTINPINLAGAILLSHAAMDRIFGFGLKYEQGFKFTHLGTIK